MFCIHPHICCPRISPVPVQTPRTPTTARCRSPPPTTWTDPAASLLPAGSISCPLTQVRQDTSSTSSTIMSPAIPQAAAPYPSLPNEEPQPPRSLLARQLLQLERASRGLLSSLANQDCTGDSKHARPRALHSTKSTLSITLHALPYAVRLFASFSGWQRTLNKWFPRNGNSDSKISHSAVAIAHSKFQVMQSLFFPFMLLHLWPKPPFLPLIQTGKVSRAPQHHFLITWKILSITSKLWHVNVFSRLKTLSETGSRTDTWEIRGGLAATKPGPFCTSFLQCLSDRHPLSPDTWADPSSQSARTSLASSTQNFWDSANLKMLQFHTWHINARVLPS